MVSEGISLGWNCDGAVYGVVSGLRKTKKNGYNTCPFDQMISNYKGIIECLKDDFKYFCDTNYLQLIKIPSNSKYLNTNGDGDLVIYHTKYKFIFNHESPGHFNLHIHQKWEKGKEHYILNNYEEFIKRYSKRIQNFRNYLLSDTFIKFILVRYNSNLGNIQLLNSIIKEKYPLLKYDFVLLDGDKTVLYDHLLLMGFIHEDNEIKRLI